MKLSWKQTQEKEESDWGRKILTEQLEISFNFLFSQNRPDCRIRFLSKPEYRTIAMKIKEKLLGTSVLLK